MSDKWVTRHTLLQRAKDKNDHKAWEEFVSYYQNFIGMLIYKMRFSGTDSDDLTQEILIHLWKNLAVYDKDKASFRTWMSTVVKNTILKYYRTASRESKRRDLAAEQQEITAFLDSTPGSELEQMIEDEWKEYVSNLALERIKGMFSGNAVEVFTLSLKGLSTEEISSHLDLKKESVYVLKNRVKARFMEEIRFLVSELEY